MLSLCDPNSAKHHDIGAAAPAAVAGSRLNALPPTASGGMACARLPVARGLASLRNRSFFMVYRSIHDIFWTTSY